MNYYIITSTSVYNRGEKEYSRGELYDESKYRYYMEHIDYYATRGMPVADGIKIPDFKATGNRKLADTLKGNHTNALLFFIGSEQLQQCLNNLKTTNYKCFPVNVHYRKKNIPYCFFNFYEILDIAPYIIDEEKKLIKLIDIEYDYFRMGTNTFCNEKAFQQLKQFTGLEFIQAMNGNEFSLKWNWLKEHCLQFDIV